MKIIDKIKNFFYDEEEIEIPKEPMKEAGKKVEEVEPPLTETKKNKEVKQADNVEDIISERELFRSETTFKFPIIFEDDDFSDEKKKNKSMNVLDIENNKFRNESNSKHEKKNFRPSPIISPIYGVLGQSNDKDRTTSKNDNLLNLYDANDLDIDQVINKAYGRYNNRLEEKIEETEMKSEKVVSEDISLDLFNNIKEEEITQSDKGSDISGLNEEDEFKGDFKLLGEERLKSIDELLESTDEQDFYALVDKMYEKEEE